MAKKQQTEIEDTPQSTEAGQQVQKAEVKQTAPAIRIGQIGDYKPIPKFPKTCTNC